MISCVVLTHNSEKSLAKCLESLLWCDEILIVDDNSSDKTRDIAKKYHAYVIEHALKNNFAEQRNIALKKAKGDWVFFVDSDEIVTKKLESEIQQAIKTDQYTGYVLKRLDVLFGTQLQFGETANVFLLRLAKKNAGSWKRAVHEVWEIKGETKILEHPLLHYPHQTLSEFIDDINKYSTIHAQELYKERKRVSAFELVAFPLGKFVQNYIFRQGFRDGTPGAIMAFMMSFHSFLARSKLYMKEHNS